MATQQTTILRVSLQALCLLVFMFTAARPAAAFELKVGLTKLAPVATTRLNGIAGSYLLKIPVPERWEVKKATLTLAFVNSTALLAGNSRLVVWLNERPLGQVVLSGETPEGTVQLTLPATLLATGYNDLRFSVSQHSRVECEDPTAPELWTTLEFDRSHIELDVDLKQVPLRLASVRDFLFDPRMFAQNRVNIVPEDLTPEILEAAAIVASGTAVRFDYRPVSFSVSREIRPGMDNILIGGSAFVERMTAGASPGQGALLRILHLPGQGGVTAQDPFHALLVIQGETGEHLKRAAAAIASMSLSFPAAAAMRVDAVMPASPVPAGARGVLTPGREYTFGDIGFGTTVFREMGAQPRTLELKLPSWVLVKPNVTMRLSLHIAYGSGMRRDSALSVLVNGKFATSVHLDDVRGARFSGYRIDLPLRLFRAGANTVTFVPVLTPLVTNLCELIQSGNLSLTIFGDSVIRVPSLSFWTVMPDLHLFFQDGFPFALPPDWRETTVYLAEQNPATAAAALNILALGAQKAGWPAFNAVVTFREPTGDAGEIVAVGRPATLPASLLRELPAQVTGGGTVDYPPFKDFKSSKNFVTSELHELIAKFLPPPAPAEIQPPAMMASVRQTSEPGNGWAFVAGFQSPYNSDRSVLLYGAMTDDELVRGAEALWEPSVQSRISGGMAIFDLASPDAAITSLASGRRYHVGRLGFFPWLNRLIYRYPLVFVTLLAVGFCALCYGVYRNLKVFRKKRIGNATP